jgi:hypothetical protein
MAMAKNNKQSVTKPKGFIARFIALLRQIFKYNAGESEEKRETPKKRNPSDLDDRIEILVELDELSNYKSIIHNGREITFRVPPKINRTLPLRLKGLGRTKGDLIGNLRLLLCLNKGEDVYRDLWLSESAARNGATKVLSFTTVMVPKNSANASIIRLEGLGNTPEFGPSIALRGTKKGDLIVKLRVFLDYIRPYYGSFDSLDVDAMALEGWVYRKIDEVIAKLGRKILHVQPVTGELIADLFNQKGWQGIFEFLVNHYRLNNLWIKLETSPYDSKQGNIPGRFQQFNGSYFVWINQAYLDNPFTVAAILSHELSHVVHAQYFLQSSQQQSKDSKLQLEDERMVDFIVFMYKLGGFQIRVSKDKLVTMGYFSQQIFDRMYVIVTKALEKKTKNGVF